MKELQNTHVEVAIAPAAIKDNAAFDSFVIDRNDFPGADYIEFIANIGSIDAEMAVLKVMESDTKTDATTLGGTPALVKDSTTKPGATDDNKIVIFGIDLRKARERYLQLQATAGDGAAGTFLSAIAVATRKINTSSDADERNALAAYYA